MIKETRRNNIGYLIRTVGSQSAVAKKLDSPKLTQQRLSEIHTRRKSMKDYEAREIERKLAIPKNWLDHEGWLKATGPSLRLCKWYAQLGSDEKLLFNDVVQFVLDRCQQSGPPPAKI